MVTVLMPYRTAVSSSPRWYQKPPSPVKHTTGRSGRAHLTPRAAGKAQPRDPAQRMNVWLGSLASTMVPVQMQEWPVSVTSTPLLGGHAVSYVNRRYGRMREESG